MLNKIKNDYKRLFSNFVSLSILQIANYLLPLITLPYLVRVLGPGKYSLVAFAQAFIQYFVILTDYGFNLSATREIAIHRDNKEKLSEIFSCVMFIKMGLFLFALIIMSAVVFSFQKFSREWFIYYLTFGMVMGQVLFPVWFFQGMERMRYITLLNITAKLIFTVAVFVFITQESDYWKAPAFNSAGYIIAGIAGLYLVKKRFGIGFKFYDFKKIKNYFKDSSQFFLSRVSVSIYTSSNVFLLGFFTSNTMVGYYAIAEKLYQALQGLYQPITQVLYPYVAKEKNIALFKNIFKSVVLINIIAICVLFLFSDELFYLLFSNKI
ncbi:MAG TPA: oligosaccharide flippase family protein, partial [bacterium]|nr:oligosaccharide flippase family protein [bacterium]